LPSGPTAPLEQTSPAADHTGSKIVLVNAHRVKPTRQSRPIKRDGYRLIAQREGSHATPSASAATTSLSGRFEISVQTTGFTSRVTESSRIALLRALGLHLTQRSVAAPVMFLGDLMLLTRYTLCKHGRCGGDESGGRKCDDRCLHFSVLPPWNKKPAQRAEVRPFRERATSRHGEGVAFHLGDAFDDFRLSDGLAPPHLPALQANNAMVGFETEASRNQLTRRFSATSIIGWDTARNAVASAWSSVRQTG
jgi:hypothetical protein